MNQLNTTQDEFFEGDNDFNNIIRINNHSDADIDDSDDYDFDYDPNEMYYALNGKN